MNIVGRAQDSTKVDSLKCESAVGDHVCTKTKVSSSACGSLNGIVCTYADDDDRGLPAGMKLALETCVDECVWNVFLHDVLIVEWS